MTEMPSSSEVASVTVRDAATRTHACGRQRRAISYPRVSIRPVFSKEKVLGLICWKTIESSTSPANPVASTSPSSQGVSKGLSMRSPASKFQAVSASRSSLPRSNPLSGR